MATSTISKPIASEVKYLVIADKGAIEHYLDVQVSPELVPILEIEPNVRNREG